MDSGTAIMALLIAIICAGLALGARNDSGLSEIAFQAKIGAVVFAALAILSLIIDKGG